MSESVPGRTAETPEPKAGTLNPGIPPASLSWAARLWNWIYYGDMNGPPPEPPPEPAPAPDEEQPIVTQVRHDQSSDSLPALPTDQSVFVGFTNRLNVEGPVRDC